MKLQVVLLYTRDRGVDNLLGEALSETGATVLIARTVADALRIICHRGRELAFALLDFDSGCRGMTLLSAIHACFEHLPIVVTTSQDAEDVAALAYANGARACLNKPLHSTRLTNAIVKAMAQERQLFAA